MRRYGNFRVGPKPRFQSEIAVSIFQFLIAVLLNLTLFFKTDFRPYQTKYHTKKLFL